MRHIITLLLLLAIPSLPALPQTTHEEPRRYVWEGMGSIGLNSDGWEWNIGAAWFPWKYIGVKATVGMSADISGFVDFASYMISDDDATDGGIGAWQTPDYRYSYDEDEFYTRLTFTPAVELRSPSIILIPSQEMALRLFASPGVVMATRVRHAGKSSRWCYYSLRGGIVADIGERNTLSLGYGYSDFNLLDGLGGERRGTHSVFLSFGYKF